MSNSISSRSLKLRESDFDGLSKTNYVELNCQSGGTGTPYAITLPNTGPAQPNQILVYNGSSYVWVLCL
jgi:hypothetical protein